MHEVGLLREVLRTVEKAAAENDVSCIDTIVLEVGQISGVIPEYLEECFPAAVYRTPMEGTKLAVEIILANGRCRQCGTVFPVVTNNGVCPKCGSNYDYDILSGTECFIKEIIVPEEG